MSKPKWEDSSAPVPPEGNRCLVNWEITQLKRVWVLSDGGRIWSCRLAWFEYYTEAEGSSGERRSTHSHESSVGAGWSSTPACLCNAALPVMDGSTAESAEQVQMARGERREERGERSFEYYTEEEEERRGGTQPDSASLSGKHIQC